MFWTAIRPKGIDAANSRATTPGANGFERKTVPPAVMANPPVPEMMPPGLICPVWPNSRKPLATTGPVSEAPSSSTTASPGTIVPPPHAEV